jgi:hypothetical protein
MIAVILVGCGGGGGSKKTAATTSSTTTTVVGTAGGSGGGGGNPSTPAGGTSTGPSIASFSVPKTVTCSSSTTIQISWVTVNATEVVISIDGPGPYKTYPGPRGSDSVPFACDGRPHTYMITAKGASGQATRTVTVTRAMATTTTTGGSTITRH